ncbi:hypothetical protein B4Q13_15930, partial [Lacticaseibacillus rhamnosus]
MRNVATEMNLSETAFLFPENGGYRLRWLTPAVEVDLCGHATLASAHVLWEDGHLPADAQVIDLSKATVMPGLIDSHTHIFLWGEDPDKGGYDANILKAGIALRAERATYACKRALEQGFTTIRDLETEGAGYGDVEIKEAIEEGTIPGPRIFASTRGISTTGGYNL